MDYIAKNIRYLRVANKFTQDDIATQLGLKKGAISSYESGRSYPSVEGLIKLQSIFQVSFDDLILRDLEITGVRRHSDLDESDKELFAKLLQHRLKELQRLIIEKSPELAKELNIET